MKNLSSFFRAAALVFQLDILFLRRLADTAHKISQSGFEPYPRVKSISLAWSDKLQK